MRVDTYLVFISGSTHYISTFAAGNIHNDDKSCANVVGLEHVWEQRTETTIIDTGDKEGEAGCDELEVKRFFSWGGINYGGIVHHWDNVGESDGFRLRVRIHGVQQLGERSLQQ